MSEAPELPEIDESLIHDKRLNRCVATTVVILSVSMALVNIKDGNIVQNMEQAQANRIDTWNEYQATRVKLHMEEIAAASGGAAAAKAQVETAKYQKESADLKQAAQAAQDDYDHNNYRDDQFDLSDGLASIALATTAIAALVELWGLLYFGWATGALSILFAVAGFAQLPIHPNMIIGWLT
ncbi:hypothetical protein FHS31_000607 [Sphingomonas vulcanisoli]|uniref:DUF4337 domain-containing protein n=1 Tax=Sphingomonas vulcanisoli TaxID=1658060 RepID=A0ABX0TR21_9SPHN|nr:DUF4337 family protein [Sphingomonas vulcanisoli]NIJ07025.1 hypothetical protein [Sphingomonas vulcanisoli]